MVFFSNLLIAYYFGTKLNVDIYFYAYNTVLLIVTFITSLNSSVLIPESMRLRVSDHPENVMYFFNSFIYGYLLFTSLLCLPFFIHPVGAFTAISNYNAESLRSQQAILYMVVPLIILVALTTLLTDILASYKFFTIPILAAVINSVFSVLFVVLFHSILDVKSVILGLLISYSFNILLLLYLMKRYLHWNFSYKRIPLGKKTWSNIVYAQSGNFLTTLGSYAPLYFLSGLGTGVIAALNYAQQLATQPTSFITTQFTSVARIKMSELYVKKDYEKVNTIFLSSMRFLLFVMIPISGIFFLYADEIVTILFKRGSFDARSVRLSSDFLRYLALSLPFTAAISIAGNLYVAAQLIKASIGYQIVSNLLLIGLVWLSLKWFGYIGYPFAYLFINVLNFLVVYIFCRLFFPYITYVRVLTYMAGIIGCNALIVIALFGLKKLGTPSGSVPVVLIGGLLYGAVLLVLNRLFHLNRDVSILLGQVKEKILPGKEN